MPGMLMRHDDAGHLGARFDVAEELPQRLQTAGRGADPDDGKNRSASVSELAARSFGDGIRSLSATLFFATFLMTAFFDFVFAAFCCGASLPFARAGLDPCETVDFFLTAMRVLLLTGYPAL